MTPYYEDDAVTIYHGDARELVGQLHADVMVTDPPYGIAWAIRENKSSGSRSNSGIIGDQDTSARDDVMAAAAHIPQIVFGSPYKPPPASAKHVAVYEKTGDSGVVGSTIGLRRDIEMVYFCGPWPSAKCHRGSVFRSHHRRIKAYLHGHPHSKPPDVMAALIGLCPPGVIIDPFLGSGTTLRAAKDLGRQAIGIEIDERYCELAARRMGQGVLFT